MPIWSIFCNGFLLLVLVSTTWSINVVVSCQFGPGCLHECNCAVSCDSQTGCTGQCTAGWDGPTCQRQNVAFNQPTTQSSSYSDGGVTYGSQNAVDGKLGHNLITTPCSHTMAGTSPATWSVTLDRVYRISRFQIYNRVEACEEGQCARRLAGFTLSVGNSSSYNTCYIDPTPDGNNPGDIINASCNQARPLSGNMVQISAKGQNVLALCEVLIYVCSAGSYGNDCGQTCGLCAQGHTVCDKTSGNCPDRQGQPRCGAGHSGEKCQRDAELSCQFGPGCLHDCNCAVSCDSQIGCTGRCTAGWDGPTCQRQNVAFNRSTTQSSSYSHNGIKYGSQYAVDGKLGHSLITTPCTHTMEGASPATWSVTLDRVYRISRFQIYNRVERCEEGQCARRLAGFAVSVGNSSSYNTCYIDPTADGQNPGDIITESCNQAGPLSGNRVQISAKGGKVLALCEVLIYVCSAGSYGNDCGQTCGFCAQGHNVCDRTSGNCPDRQGQPRCGAGYSGEKCQTVCSAGSYGNDCGQTCGFCAQGHNVCDRTSGNCPDRQGQPRCRAGYSGEKCQTVCANGTYGEDCLNGCGFCAEGTEFCNGTSGDCPDRHDLPTCVAGYAGWKCQSGCEDHKWGVGCKQSCGNCYNDASCDKATGECPPNDPRCVSGYNQSSCSVECKNGTWGLNCNESCSQNCLPDSLSCHKANGTCLQGCANKYSGERCDVEFRPSRAPLPISGIAGGVIGGVVCGAIIVAVIVLYRRRRHQTSKENRSARDASELNTGGELQENVDIQLDDVGIEVAEDDNTDPSENLGESSTCVLIEKLADNVKRKKTCTGFKKEFEKFPAGLHAKYAVADKEPNKVKSRYKNLVAYDHSRVVLRMLPDDEHSDYINACHINGYKEPKKFIAAQGPNEVIINDFVRMIWEQNTGKVVMLTNLVEGIKVKCDQYWPTKGAKRFGLIEVTLFDEEVSANYTIRTLKLTHAKIKNTVMTVQQFHFTTWPDHGAPAHATGLLEFWHKVVHQPTALTGPIIVHCSAGIGRTGTFIALDYLINQAKEENSVDVAACVRELRQQRVNMIQTQVQYEFLHEALVEGIQLSDCYVSSENFANVYNQLMTTNSETEQTKMAEQFKILQELRPGLGKNDFKAARQPENRTKNRSNQILASDSSRPFLSTPVTGCNDYINAVFMPSFKLRRGFILTQTPLQNTVVDFWRLVYEFNVSTIVMLDSVAQHKNVGIYWPEKTETFNPFVVETIKVDESEDFCVSTYKLTYKDMEAQHHVQQLRCKFWPGKPSPKSLSSLLLVMQNAETWQRTTENCPILVHCRDGVTKSGMYCVASSIIERLKADHEVNILQTVAEMRTSRPEIIANSEQYECLYQIINGYLKNFQTYANFS